MKLLKPDAERGRYAFPWSETWDYFLTWVGMLWPRGRWWKYLLGSQTAFLSLVGKGILDLQNASDILTHLEHWEMSLCQGKCKRVPPIWCCISRWSLPTTGSPGCLLRARGLPWCDCTWPGCWCTWARTSGWHSNRRQL